LIVTTASRKSWGPSTLAVHAGNGPDPATGAVMTPIYATSTFVQSAPGVTTGWEYARSGNPTRADFERALADVEGGSAGFAFASGLAAEATVLDLLAHGSHVITSQGLYGGTWRLLHRHACRCVRCVRSGRSRSGADAAHRDGLGGDAGQPAARHRRS
jgi:cystathionine gamma-lyase